MTDQEGKDAAPQQEQYASTSYSSKITCGVCRAPVRNVPAMYESINVDWRCAKCLRTDKPAAGDHTA